MEPTIEYNGNNIENEQPKCTKRIKKEPKTRKRTKKSNRRKDDEGNDLCAFDNFVDFLIHSFLDSIKKTISFYYAEDIKEEEMVIEALDYDADDFENDPTFAIVAELENRDLDDLDDIGDEDSDNFNLDEPKDRPKRKRRKVQVPDNKIHK